MKQYFAIIGIILVVLFSSGVSSAEKYIIDPIDKEMEDCIKKDSTTSGMGTCALKALESWDKELNVAYGQLSRKLDKITKDNLLNSQRKWIEYRDREYKFIDNFFYNFQGSMYGSIMIGEKIVIVKQRTLALMAYMYYLTIK